MLVHLVSLLLACVVLVVPAVAAQQLARSHLHHATEDSLKRFALYDELVTDGHQQYSDSSDTDTDGPTLSGLQAVVTVGLVGLVIGGAMLYVWLKHRAAAAGANNGGGAPFSLPSFSMRSLRMPRFRGGGRLSSSSAPAPVDSRRERLLNDDDQL